MLLVYSGVRARADTKERANAATIVVSHPVAGTARFELPADKLADPLSDFKANESAVVVIVRSQAAPDTKVTTKVANRFNVTLRDAVKSKGNTDPLTVTLIRGTNDETALQFAEALAELERYYVLPDGSSD